MSLPERSRTYSSALAAVRVKRGSTTIILVPVSFACSMCSIETGCASAAFEPMYIAHFVVRVRHRAVAPRVRDARDRSGVADAGLVVAVVATPQADPLAQQVGL